MDVFLQLIKKTGRSLPVKIEPLPRSGSSREYYRFFFESNETLIGSFNPEVKENIAYLTFSRHFYNLGFPVPKILAYDNDYKYFLLTDLGNTTLFDILKKEGVSERVRKLYYRALEDLLRFQVEGIKGMDLSKAYPVNEFDKRSVMWDLNYFKYFFLKANNIYFDESSLEDDFVKLTDTLLEADRDFFMYRDFQSRNIMIKTEKLWYIDFQGGRKGPLQYDVVSLLFQAKANLPESFKNELLQYYLLLLEKEMPSQRDVFLEKFNLFVYFRLMQVLGAYGYRGLFQRKSHFLQSIPPAINNLKRLINNNPVADDFKELDSIFGQIINLSGFDLNKSKDNILTVRVSSFSYKKTGIPVDISGNGGGFVFDCRALPNPGRLDELKDFTGQQKPIIEYLSSKKEVLYFLDKVFALVEQSVDNYLKRGFENLMVNFGCTGGKHRSVYSAEKLISHLKKKYGEKINLVLSHYELEKEKF
jgi:aminoglycoside/choline kinase family phosphotransferase